MIQQSLINMLQQKCTEMAQTADKEVQLRTHTQELYEKAKAKAKEFADQNQLLI